MAERQSFQFLNSTKNNDKRKFQACLEKNIELCIIDTSTQKYFKETTSKIYLDIILKIINNKLLDIQSSSNLMCTMNHGQVI